MFPDWLESTKATIWDCMLDTQLNAYTETQSKAATDRAIILQKSKEVLNFTTQEMADLLGWEYHHAQPRISQLVDKDLLKDTGLRREGRERTSAVWAYNPEPRPKRHKIRPIGDKELFGKMLESAYIYAHEPHAHRLHQMHEAAKDWITDFSRRVKCQ